MKNARFAVTLFLAVAFVTAPLAAVPVKAQDPQTQNQATAIMRGYRTGYSDGYQAGVSDLASNAAREFKNKTEYEHGDRAYNANYGTLEEYRDGYQQGFEAGYNAGFDRKPFDSSAPADLKRRTEDSSVGYPTDQNKGGNQNKSADSTSPQPQPAQSNNPDMIPRDTIMRVELLSNLSTEASQIGDRFSVRVIEPKEYEGATIDGRVVSVKRPGKAKGTAQLQLAFEEIRFSNGRSSKMSAQVIEVISTGGSQGVGKVDKEGGVQGSSSTKGDVQRVGAAAGIGALIGAIAGGGVGAAVGATIGAGVGTAGVLSQRGKDINLSHGQQLRIRTAGDVQVQ
jgi:type IV secretion system protein VirB10